jgi:hypothetical protein
VAACVLLLSLGGCTVSAGAQETTPTKVTDVLEQRSGEFDLTRPPDRAEAGMPDGSAFVHYERDDHQPFRVGIALPEGKRLDLDTRLVGFDSYAAADPATAPPTTLDIHHYPATLEEGRDHLLATADEFGFDPAPILEWYREATGPAPAAAAPTLKSRWLTSTVGYLQMEVQGRYDRPVDTPESAQTVVHYLLTWQ